MIAFLEIGGFDHET